MGELERSRLAHEGLEAPGSRRVILDASSAATRRAYRAAGRRGLGILHGARKGDDDGLVFVRRRIDAPSRVGAVGSGFGTSTAGIAGSITRDRPQPATPSQPSGRSG